MDSEQNNNGDTQQSQAPPAFDPKELQSAIVTAIRESQPQQQPAAPTQAELDADLKVWNPDPEFVNEFRTALQQEDLEDNARITPFTKLRDGLIQQSQRFAELHIQKQFQLLLPQLAPLVQHYQRAQQEEAEKSFYDEYPVLKDYPEVVQAVASQLSSQKVSADTPAAARKILAERVEAMVKKFRPDFTLGASNTTSNNNNGAMPRMATLSNGASGGGKPSSNGASIWD